MLVSSSDGAWRPRLDGTFLQLTHAHLRWSDARWQRLFEHFATLGLTELVVQWTRYDDTSFCPDDAPCLVDKVLDHADRFGLGVLVGLAHRSDFWDRIKAPAEDRRAYLAGLRDASLATAAGLAPVVGRHPSFRGWYLSEEIDDVSWNDPAERRILVEHLAELSFRLRAETADAFRIGVSGFSNAALAPDGLTALWTDILGASAIDVLLFQDGIGVGKLTLAELDPYLAAVSEATHSANRTLWVVVETFERTDNGDDTFTARPASLGRIEAQLAVAAIHADTLIAFSVPEYMTPLGGPAATALFRRYRDAVIAPSQPPAAVPPARLVR